jgi:LysR family transcriptional regulator, regulator for metE and metH
VDATHLQHEHVVTYDAPRSELTLFTDIMDPAGLVPRRHSRIQLTEAMIELVKAGMAIAILPRWLVVTHAASAHMRAVRLTRKGIRREWCAATLRGPSVPPHVIEFTGLLSELVQMGALFT